MREARAAERHEKARFRAFVGSFRTERNNRPTAWYGHFLLPHPPFHYLPDGREYEGLLRPLGLHENWVHWSSDAAMVAVARQRFMLQLKYVDSLVATMVKTLKATGLFDESLIIVTSDHGLSFDPGYSRRGSPLTRRAVPDILPVPMFVKYPNQRVGTVDPRPAQTIDLLPTIADVLGAQPGHNWRFNGRSLQARPLLRPKRYVDPNGGVAAPDRFDITAGVTRYRKLFGDWRSRHDLFAWGPHADLVGRSVPSGLEPIYLASLEQPLLTYTPTGRYASALLTYPVRHSERGSWFAVTVRGVVIGLGRVSMAGEPAAGVAMIDPSLLNAGDNALHFFSLTDEIGRPEG
jgi:hypothetical protein